MLSPCSTLELRKAKRAPNFSINWTVLDGHMEATDTITGKRATDKQPSRICKRALFKLYQLLLSRLGNNGREALADTFIEGVAQFDYGTCKQKSVQYQNAKRELYSKMRKCDVGIWVKKPTEVEQFRLQTMSTTVKQENVKQEFVKQDDVEQSRSSAPKQEATEFEQKYLPE